MRAASASPMKDWSADSGAERSLRHVRVGWVGLGRMIPLATFRSPPPAAWYGPGWHNGRDAPESTFRLRRRGWSCSRLSGGDEIHLRYQGWDSGPSRRQMTAARHGVTVAPSQPDIVVQRAGVLADRVVLELKASRRPGTLGDGLSQLLGYLYERPLLFDRMLAGWLVPLPNAIATLADADPAEPLWIVAADQVASAVTERRCGRERLAGRSLLSRRA